MGSSDRGEISAYGRWLLLPLHTVLNVVTKCMREGSKRPHTLLQEKAGGSQSSRRAKPRRCSGISAVGNGLPFLKASGRQALLGRGLGPEGPDNA